MKIIILNDYASVQGGAAQVAVQSAIALAQTGHEVMFIYGAGKAEKKLVNSGVKCIGLNQYDLLTNPSRLNAGVAGIWNITVEKKLTKILKEHHGKNVIVHIHSWVKSLSVSALASVINSGLPKVLTLHDYFTVCPNGGFYNYKTQKPCQLKPMSVNCMMSNCDSRSYNQKLWRVLRQLFYKRALFPEKLNNFISVSDFSENLLRSYLPVNSKFYRVSNPINITKLPKVRPSDSDMFTYIGRLSPEKGVKILLDFQEIPQEKLRFVGTGELETYLKEKLPRANFEGWCNKSQILSFLNDSRALIFPSLLYETQGLVVLEAAARGVPSVVSSISAAKDFIDNGDTGIVFKNGNNIDLESQLLTLSQDSNFVDRLGSNAYQKYWETPASMKSHVANLISCYKDIITKHHL